MGLVGLAGNGQAGGVSPHPYLYLPDGWDTGWKTAKAAAATSPLIVTVSGDSIASGCFTGPTNYSNAYPNLLQAKLAALYGTYADYYNASENTGQSITAGAAWSAAVNGALGQRAALGWFNATWTNVTSAAQSAQQFTTPYACTAIDLLYVDFFNCTWGYKVDGGTTNNVTNTGNGTAAGSAVKKISLTGLSNATHTIDWGYTTTSPGPTILGCSIYKPGITAGLGFVRMSCNGGMFNDHLNNDANGDPPSPAKKLELFTNKSPQNDATGPGAGSFGFPLGSHLFISALGVNDISSTQTPLNTGTYATRLVKSLRRAVPNASVIFLIHAYPDVDTSDTTSALANQTQLFQYYQYLYTVASMYKCAVVNIDAKWGETPTGQGFLNNNIHPINAGHTDIANTLFGIL